MLLFTSVFTSQVLALLAVSSLLLLMLRLVSPGWEPTRWQLTVDCAIVVFFHKEVQNLLETL